MTKRKKIGEILVENGACTQEQVEECLHIQKERGAGRRLGEILIENEYLSEDQLLAGLSLQTGIPFANEIDEEVHVEVLEQCRDIAGPEEMTDFDLFTAGGFALLGTQTIYDEIQKLQHEESDVSRYFQKKKYKNKGRG